MSSIQGMSRFTYNPVGWICTIRSLTRSPISFIHAFTCSRSVDDHTACESVAGRSFFMYARSTSVSNGGLGGERGDTAPDRKTGERSPRDVILARKCGGQSRCTFVWSY